jgi:hypothetical protein
MVYDVTFGAMRKREASVTQMAGAHFSWKMAKNSAVRLCDRFASLRR